MDPQTAAALANSVAHLNLLYVVTGVVIVAAVFSFVGALGERALGLDLKRFVNNVEKRADKGDVWPGVVSFILTPAALAGIVLWIGLR